MPTKKKTTKRTKKTAPPITIHGSGLKITVPNDAKAPDKIRKFISDRLKLGAYQLVTSNDDAGQVVETSQVQKFDGSHLYVRERNKGQ